MTVIMPESARRRGRLSPATLLRADAEVVPFRGREQELAELSSWCDEPDELSARLIVGPGGQGKTRLARELVHQRIQAGWTAGFVASDPPGQPLDFVSIADAAEPVLLVLDYAETRTDQITRLVSVLQAATDSAPVRLLLLARGAGDWWEQLRRRCPDPFGAAAVLTLPTLDDSLAARQESFDIAVDSFVPALADVDRTIPWQDVAESVVTPDDLDADRYGAPLTLQMSALLALLRKAAQRNTSDSRLSLSTLNNEVEIYEELVKSGHTELIRYLAEALISQAEVLVTRGSTKVGLASAEEAVQYARIVASNDIRALPTLARALSVYGGALIAVGRLEEASSILDECVQDYNQMPEDQRTKFLPDLASALNRKSTVFAALGRSEQALIVAQQTADIYRTLAKTNPDANLPNLALSLTNLSSRLGEVGRQEEALATAQEAAVMYRTLAKTNPDANLPNLALSLTNLSSRLGEVGRQEEALATAQEAAVMYRTLAKTNPDANLPNLALSLTNLSSRLGEVGRQEEALATAQEAADLYRTLAEANPDAYQPNLASSLTSIGLLLSNAGHLAEAVAVTQEATGMLRRLTRLHPGIYRVPLAINLNNLGRALTQTGRYKEAVEALREAITIFQEVGHRYGEGAATTNLGGAQAERRSTQLAKNVSDRGVSILSTYAKEFLGILI